MNFKQLGISNDLVNTLNQMGIKNPTPIQEEAIPLIINKKRYYCTIPNRNW